MLKQFSTLMVYVRDMDRAVSFYGDVLGLPLQVRSEGWSQLRLPNGIALGLHFSSPNGDEPKPGWLPMFEVDNIVAAREHLMMAGVTVGGYHDIPGGVVLDILDPDGNHINLMQMGTSSAEIGDEPDAAEAPA